MPTRNGRVERRVDVDVGVYGGVGDRVSVAVLVDIAVGLNVAVPVVVAVGVGVPVAAWVALEVRDAVAVQAAVDVKITVSVIVPVGTLVSGGRIVGSGGGSNWHPDSTSAQSKNARTNMRCMHLPIMTDIERFYHGSPTQPTSDWFDLT